MNEEEARKRQIEAARATREYAPVMAQEVSMSEHTAGPWELGGGSPDEGEKIVSAPGTNPSFDDPNGREWIATVYDTGPLGPGPNARLIAAAPALLAALEAILDVLKPDSLGYFQGDVNLLTCEHMIQACEAIKEAEGE